MFATKKIALSLLSVSLFTSTQVMAISSVTLDVTGTITPVACTPTLGSSGINFGAISIGDLSTTEKTPLEMKTVSISIDCAGATAPFAIRAVDNALGSSFETADGTNFGLGMQGTNKVGQYTIHFANGIQGDGAEVKGIASPDSGATWVPAVVAADRGPVVRYDGGWLGFADNSSDTAVKPLETLTGTLQIRPEIAPTSGLDVTANFGFAGSATLIVEYL